MRALLRSLLLSRADLRCLHLALSSVALPMLSALSVAVRSLPHLTARHLLRLRQSGAVCLKALSIQDATVAVGGDPWTTMAGDALRVR